MSSRQPFYGSERWRRRAAHQLQIEPLCRYCFQFGKVVPATDADHVLPHKGDARAFYFGELQSLCKCCHVSTKAQIERRGYDVAYDVRGFPIDSNHPAYAVRSYDEVAAYSKKRLRD